MRLSIAAAFALVAESSLAAQTTSTTPDLTTAVPIAGNWSYAATGDGSEAVFANSTDYPQIWIHCTRATQVVSIARPSAAAVPTMSVWTSSATRTIGTTFNPATGRLTIALSSSDPLLDAIASSRGRTGFAIGGSPALVVPAWAEVARVIEDCRG